MISAQRFKQIREELGFTQSAFAERLKIKSTTADIERGKMKISGPVIMELLQQHHINPLWLYGRSERKYLNPEEVQASPKMITVDNVGHENILLVNAKAAAGYAGNLGDEIYYGELPTFTVPLPEYRNASFRGFQVEGDSMSPSIQHGEWVMAKAVSDISEVRNGNIYVLVQQEGIRIKEVQLSEDHRLMTLVSHNTAYRSDEIESTSLQEVWEYHSKLTIGRHQNSTAEMLRGIYDEIAELRKQLPK